MGDPIVNKVNSPNGMIRSIVIGIGFNCSGKLKMQMHSEAQGLKQASP